MSDFNEWCRENHPDCNPQFIYGGLVWKSRQAEIDELQKRIDNALDFAEDVHSENWQETLNTMLYILKG